MTCAAKLVFLLVLGAASHGGAAVTGDQTHQPGARPITLEECIRTALFRNRALQIQRLNPEIDLDTLSGSRGYYVPLFSVDFRRENSTNSGGFDPTDLAVTRFTRPSRRPYSSDSLGCCPPVRTISWVATTPTATIGPFPNSSSRTPACWTLTRSSWSASDAPSRDSLGPTRRTGLAIQSPPDRANQENFADVCRHSTCQSAFVECQFARMLAAARQGRRTSSG